MKLIGILTLAHTDDTPAFARLRKGLANHYKEGTDISLHFQFAHAKSELSNLANLLVRIPVDVLLTGGMRAANAALAANTAAATDIPIVYIGDAPQIPTGVKNVTGHFLTASAMCEEQLDKLLSLQPAPTIVTVLVADPNNNSMNNPIYAALYAYAQGKVELKPLTISTRDQFKNLKPTDVEQAFMVIPNGMFFDSCEVIAALVDGRGIKVIYPEPEYKDVHTIDKTNVWVHGHDIPGAFESAAKHIYNFLEDKNMQDASPADKVKDKFP